MELTPERKAELEAEERARQEIRRKLAIERREARQQPAIEAAPPSTPAPLPPRTNYAQWIFAALGITIVAVFLLALADSGEPSIRQLPAGDGAGDRDQLGLILTMAGAPDDSKSTEYDSPKPPVVSKILYYRRAGVKVAFLKDPSTGGWRLLGFMDLATGQEITDATGLMRLRRR